jgi:hypothetical protein
MLGRLSSHPLSRRLGGESRRPHVCESTSVASVCESRSFGRRRAACHQFVPKQTQPCLRKVTLMFTSSNLNARTAVYLELR